MKYDKSDIRMWSMLGPSGVFGLAVCELAEDPDFAVITADLCSFSGLDRFSRLFPEQFYNVGIAEQNMVGIASGMAKEGMNVFATTYASFASTRSLDQVKVNMGYMGLPVKLFGFTSGFSAGILGATHMAVEDLAIFRAIPNIVVVSPADATETMKAIFAVSKLNVPVYVRMSGASRMPIIYKADYPFELGKAIRLREGEDVSVLATGTMVNTALKAADLLEKNGVSCEVVDVHTIKPIDAEAIKAACSKKLIVTIEEHSAVGGLGSAVSEVLAPIKNSPPQLIIGANDCYLHAASYETLLDRSCLTYKKTADKIYNFYKENV